jgi:hypothetical protein
MDVIFRPSHPDRRALEFFGDTGQIAMHFVAQAWVTQKRLTLLG